MTDAVDPRRARLAQFELAAEYARLNGFASPVLTLALGWTLTHWASVPAALWWTVPTIVSQLMMGWAAHGFLNDPDRSSRMPHWEVKVGAATFLSSALFGSISILFYVEGDRINNLLMFAIPVGTVASMMLMTAPYLRMMFPASILHAVYLVSVPLFFEPAPFNLIFPVLAILYVTITTFSALTLNKMVGQLVRLRLAEAAMGQTLEREKRAAEDARLKAEAANQTKSNFLANMSHELRTPLNAILGFSDIIRNRMFGDGAVARYADYAKDIHRSGAHLLSLIDDVLDLSRIEAGKLELHEEVLNLDAAAQEILTSLGPQAQARNVSLSSQADPGVTVYACGRSVRQVLLNLASNAVKFSRPGGQVTIAVSVLAGGETAISVTDRGVGIAPADLPRVLENFGQGRHDVAQSADKGMGLGLPISKGLMEAHGGTLDIASELGTGTTVTVTFPADRLRPAPPALERAAG